MVVPLKAPIALPNTFRWNAGAVRSISETVGGRISIEAYSGCPGSGTFDPTKSKHPTLRFPGKDSSASPNSTTTAIPSTTQPSSTGNAPTLGREWASAQQGYGSVRPSTIFNGGDPTGAVTDVHWQSWGGPQAMGQGTSDYVADNQTVAEGTQEPATVVAFDLGMCQGKLAYRAIEWFFPQHGQAFNTNRYINICTGAFVGY
jgi:hypothetical protein